MSKNSDVQISADEFYKTNGLEMFLFLSKGIRVLAHLVYQPKSVMQSCLVRRTSSSCVLNGISVGDGIGVGVGIGVCAHLS